jgi:RNA polymerase primary sigma factor
LDKDKRRNDGNEILNRYMREVNKIDLLEREEEDLVYLKIKSNNEQERKDAIDTLINSNLKLVVKIAHDFNVKSLPLDDLVAEGNIGLITAANKFDPILGVKFSYYASFWIKQAIRKAMTNKARIIRTPMGSFWKNRNLNGKMLKLRETLGREPSDFEICDFLKIKTSKVDSVRQYQVEVVSMNAKTKHGEKEFEMFFGDFKDFRVENEEKEIFDLISKEISNLTEIERTILIMRLGLDENGVKTLEEVSIKVGKTKERIRQIQQEIIKKIKQKIMKAI